MRQKRLLEDLLNAMRKRRRLAFSGFSFAKQADVDVGIERFFAPDAFKGFLTNRRASTLPSAAYVFFNPFRGFLNGSRKPKSTIVIERSIRIFAPVDFNGFGYRANPCLPHRTLMLKSQTDHLD